MTVLGRGGWWKPSLGILGAPLDLHRTPHTCHTDAFEVPGLGSWKREEREQRAEGGDRWQLHKAPKDRAEKDNNRGRRETKADRAIRLREDGRGELKEAWIPSHRHDTL